MYLKSEIKKIANANEVIEALIKGYFKFRGEPVTRKMVKDEIAQVKKTELNCYRYGFISRSGFKDVNKDNDRLVLIKLEDLFG